MLRTLSIRSTPLLKFALAPMWIGAVGYAVWLLWTDPQAALGGREPGASMVALQWFLLALIAASLLVLFAFVVPLKRVQLASDSLRVSNYVREITVPFGAIARVRQHWLPTFRLITLDLRGETPFGHRIIFMPAVPQRLAFWRQSYWHEDEMVRELRALAGLPKAERSQTQDV